MPFGFMWMPPKRRSHSLQRRLNRSMTWAHKVSPLLEDKPSLCMRNAFPESQIACRTFIYLSRSHNTFQKVLLQCDHPELGRMDLNASVFSLGLRGRAIAVWISTSSCPFIFWKRYTRSPIGKGATRTRIMRLLSPSSLLWTSRWGNIRFRIHRI